MQTIFYQLGSLLVQPCLQQWKGKWIFTVERRINPKPFVHAAGMNASSEPFCILQVLASRQLIGVFITLCFLTTELTVVDLHLIRDGGRINLALVVY